MKSRREVGFRLIIAGFGLMASILASSAFGQANAGAQPAAMVGPAALQQGELEVWVPKTHVMGRMGDPTASVTEEYPWTTLLNEFHHDFPKFKLRFKILDLALQIRGGHGTVPMDLLGRVVAFLNGF